LTCSDSQGHHRLASGLETTSVEAIRYVQAQSVPKVGQGVEYAEISGPIRACRGTTEKPDFDSFSHLANGWATRPPKRPEYNATGVI
jgi:hypothetical protein